jgi:hypothetical protein
MRVLFIISSSETAFWLSEVTHPYWLLAERGVAINFASPAGGKVVHDPYSDPYFEHSPKPMTWSARVSCPTKRWPAGWSRR